MKGVMNDQREKKTLFCTKYDFYFYFYMIENYYPIFHGSRRENVEFNVMKNLINQNTRLFN